MTEEIYDVFDETGVPIGTASWTECHTKGLLHRSASALIFRDESRQETLIQQRSFTMAHFPGLWTHAVGGHLLAGDSVEQGMLRELQEELFWQHKLPQLSLNKVVTFLNHDMPHNREFLTLFEVVYPGPFYPNPSEVAETHWIEWKTLMDAMREDRDRFAPVFHKVVDVYSHPAVARLGPQF
jgi:isopentenyldiphosphate isomerase